MSKKTYSISELAVQLQLPRTTINDWLKSFSPYLEFEMRGKRKEFNRNALEVLKNISVWKNEGKSASVIQKLLEEKYGILGEVTAGNNEEPAEEAEKNEASNDSSGEIMQVVHSDIELLLANVEQLNEKRIKSTRRAAWGSIIVMLLILAGVGAVAYFIYTSMLKLQMENAAAKQEYVKKIEILQNENKQQLEELNKLRKLELEKLSSDFNIRNKKFQQELQTQKDELAKAFKELEKSVAANREAEMLKMREAFAAEQKAALEKLVAKEKELSSIQYQLGELRKDSEVLQKKTSELNKMLEKERNANKKLESENIELNKTLSSMQDDAGDKL